MSNFHPTLGKFLDIIRSTNEETILPASNPGMRTKVYVNQKPYSEGLRDITLLKHTTITIEVGPPFKPPQTYDFGNM